MRVLFLLLFFFSFVLGEEFGQRKLCHAVEEERTWGAHNVLPNLYLHVYKPFLDAFTYAAMCDDAIPVDCDEGVPESGEFWQRCQAIGADTLLAQYSFLSQYLLGLNIPFYASPAFQRTFQVTKKCSNVVRKGDAAFQNYRECSRATLAYQCIWNNVLWLTVPLAIAVFVGILSFFTGCISLGFYMME